MNKFKKAVGTGLAVIVSTLMPFMTRADFIPVHSQRETRDELKIEYFCGGWMYTKDGHIIGLYDGFYPKAEARRVMDFQKEAERIWHKYGVGSQELKDYLSNFPDLTFDFEAGV